MRGEKMLEAVGYLTPALIESAAVPESEIRSGTDPAQSPKDGKESVKKRNAVPRRVWAAAAFVCAAGILWFSLWAFVPVARGEQAARFTFVKIGDRLAEYRVEETSRWQTWTANLSLGDEIAENLYRVKGEDDLVRLIRVGSDAQPEILRFGSFLVDLTEDSPLPAMLGLTEEDRAALAYGESYTFGEVLGTVYGISSREDLKSVTFEKDTFDRSAVGKRVRVEKVVLRDEESLARFRGILTSLVRSPGGEDENGPRRVYAGNPDYESGKAPLSVQTDRLVTVRLNNGEKIFFHYAPREGILYENYGVLYNPIPEDDNEWLIGRVGIDLTPRDRGTNAEPVGAETAQPPKGE